MLNVDPRKEPEENLDAPVTDETVETVNPYADAETVDAGDLGVIDPSAPDAPVDALEGEPESEKPAEAEIISPDPIPAPAPMVTQSAFSEDATKLANHFGANIVSEVNGVVTLDRGGNRASANLANGYDAARRGIHALGVL